MIVVQISDHASAVECCGQKRLRVAGGSEKRTPWWNQDLKEAIRAKKDAFKDTEEGVRSSIGFQLFIGKQSILVNDSSFAWQKIKLQFLH